MWDPDIDQIMASVIETIEPLNFLLFDKFIKVLAMLFLNRASSPTTTAISVPDVNRPC